MAEDYTLFELIPAELIDGVLDRTPMVSFRELEKAVPSIALRIATIRQRRLGNSDSVDVLEPIYIELESIVGRRDYYLLYIRGRRVLETRDLLALARQIGNYHLPHLAKHICGRTGIVAWNNFRDSDLYTDRQDQPLAFALSTYVSTISDNEWSKLSKK